MINIYRMYAVLNARLCDKLLKSGPVAALFLNPGKFTVLKYCLVVSIFYFLIGCALVDETPIDPVSTPVAPAQIEHPTVTLVETETAAPVAIEPPTIAPFDEALTAAVDALFSQASRQVNSVIPAEQKSWVINPLIDGLSGIQSNATRAIENRAVEIVRSKYPQFAFESFSAANLHDSPLLLLGTFTPVNMQGKTTGPHEGFRICLILADIKNDTIAAKVTTSAYIDGVDHSPTPYFRDSPGWTEEGATEEYISNCQASKIGDPLQASYRGGISAAAFIADAITAYDHGRYREALDLFAQALKTAAGNQLLIYNGLYLANTRLGRHAAANEAFNKLVDHGLTRKRLAIKFLFKPGTTAYSADRQTSASYSIWLKQIARRIARSDACLEITGHTSATGAEPLNEQLSQLRAEYIKKQLELQSPQLRGRTIASGAGSRENLLGTGTDDMSDALDRRVVFQVHSCL
jgi:outer membrane protein OmpA-like peptidoglycan-associated protein